MSIEHIRDWRDLLTPEEQADLDADLRKMHDARLQAEVLSRDWPMA